MDFYLPDYNAVIEYDGIQHYQPIETFGGEKAFKSTKIRDEIKNTYCRENGIKMIRISYKLPFNEIASYILSELGINKF
jgi:very-short-patch-repair endonuclease